MSFRTRAATAVVAAVSSAVLLPASPAAAAQCLDRAEYRLIKPGMSLHDVKVATGMAGDYLRRHPRGGTVWIMRGCTQHDAYVRYEHTGGPWEMLTKRWGQVRTEH